MAEFNFLENLPLFIFILAFFVVFVLFLFGGFVLLKAGDDEQKLERGRKILLNSLYALFIILLVVFAFFLVTYLLQKGEALRPPEAPGEFPSSPAINFPPSPEFINIGKYYFIGPWSLKENNIIGKTTLYTILCKKDEEYDIMYIGETVGGERLLEHGQYRCWLKNCNQKLGNLYLTVFLTPKEKYTAIERGKIKEELKGQVNPPCPPAESNI